MGNWYLPNGLVYRGNTLRQESVLVLHGRVAAFGEEANALRDDSDLSFREVDARDCLISRGFIDLHIHLREPGFTEKETIASGTAAAAAGGFTSVCPMPNTEPPLDSLERLYDLQVLIAQRAQVKVHPIAALTVGRNGTIPVDYESFVRAGVHLFSDDGDPLLEATAGEVFRKVGQAGGVLINHLEDKSLVGEGFFYEQIPAESEYLMLKRDLALVKQTNCRYHAAHLSCQESVELIGAAQRAGLPVSAEVTPHHLTLTYEDVAEPKGHFQMKPPLRGRADQQALLAAVEAGTIDFIATDHAPHGTEKENGLFPGSPFGVTGLETAFPVLYTHLVKAGKLGLERLLHCLTAGPAQLLGIAGDLQAGAAADLAVVDLKSHRRVEKENFKSRGTNSPYLGQTLVGWPVLTIVDGQERYLWAD